MASTTVIELLLENEMANQVQIEQQCYGTCRSWVLVSNTVICK